MIRRHAPFALRVLCVLALPLIFAGCVTADGEEWSLRAADGGERSLRAAIPEHLINTEPRRLAAEGIRQLDEANLDQALSAFNKALKLKTADSTLNFLAGLTYHLMALKGDASKFDLARQGYDLSIRFDRTNWLAHYHVGLLDLDQRNFEGAQSKFAETLLFRSDDPAILYNMVVASYYTRDLPAAAAALGQLRRLQPDSPRTLRAAAIVNAALDQPLKARSELQRLAAVTKDENETRRFERRLQDWRRLHAQIAQSQSEGENIEKEEAAVESDEESSADEDGESEPDQNRMAIVDVVIIRTQEDLSTDRGVNLLNGLQVRFGTSSADAFNVTRTRSKDFLDSAMSISTKAITSIISIPAVTYSLNIANSNDQRNEILARPTLVALDGQESTFFSGVKILAAQVSTGTEGGEAVVLENDIGVTLTLTPEFLDDGRIKMAVMAERTFLNTPNTRIEGFELRIEEAITSVTANIAMEFGETLILSGLSEKEVQVNRDGVPFLQDIPIVQYLFSNLNTRNFTRSVLILVTPRRPEFVYEKGGRKQSRRPGENPALNEFRARFSDWFRPYPNWASVFHHMQENQLYREFRTGDVELESWERGIELRDRLKIAVDFLYF